MLNRRKLLAGTARVALASALTGALTGRSAFAARTEQEGTAFSYDALVERARTMGGLPFEPVSESLPGPVAELGYDQYRDIRFRPEQALWRDQGLPFQAQFFHLGTDNKRPVHFLQITDGHPRGGLSQPAIF